MTWTDVAGKKLLGAAADRVAGDAREVGMIFTTCPKDIEMLKEGIKEEWKKKDTASSYTIPV